ncbi:hypothetical protein DYB31_010702, partial [Aphanomyces astaci]
MFKRGTADRFGHSLERKADVFNVPVLLPMRRGYTSTLLWKNFLLKKKHPIKWALEVLLPVALILLMGGLKTLTDDVKVPDGWSTDKPIEGSDTIGTSYSLFHVDTMFGVPLPKFYQTEGTVSGLLLQMATKAWDARQDSKGMTAAQNEACSAAAYSGNVNADVNSPSAWPAICRDNIIPQKLAIAPDNDFTRKYFLETLSLWYPRVSLDANGTLAVPSIADSVQFFADETALNAYVTNVEYAKSFSTPRIAAAIVFTAMPSPLGSAGNIEYSIRLNSTLGRGGVTGDVPRTNLEPFLPLQRSINTDSYTRYAKSGFMSYQTLVTRFALCVPDWNADTRTTTGTCTQETAVMAAGNAMTDATLVSTQLQADLNVFLSIMSYTNATKKPFNLNSVPLAALSALAKPLRQMPQPVGGASVFAFPIQAFTSSPFYQSVKDFFGLVFVLSYLHALSSVLVALISEKETKARELMKILGVPESAIVLSWYITYGAIFVVAAVLQAVVGKVVLFPNSNVLLLLVFFLLFGWAVLAYGYMVSAIFSKSRTGTYIGMIGFFAMYLVTAGFNDTSAAKSKAIACLFAPAALTFGVKSLAESEASGIGITSANAGSDINNFKFTTAILFLVVDVIMYTLLGLYFERVVPKDYGVTETWYFAVTPSYWRKKLTKKTAKAVSADALAVALDVHSDNMEDVGIELKQQETSGHALRIQNLRKVFAVPGGEKVAVKGINLTMYKNQITCLLGHNGAGKTTLISMLTGMIPATSGDATVHGLSLHDDLGQLRRSLGMCPQHDVLYAELTVHDHLMFYGKIKGYRGHALESEVDAKIVEVGLTEKRHVRTSDLSGGMKRKLSLAIALLGDSKIVFLDEPTSGMDPYSRRSSWEIILNNRYNRIIVLTTHFMDEADILGDRIAIMAEGELRCCGSSM